MLLTGSEVKSLRNGRANIAESPRLGGGRRGGADQFGHPAVRPGQPLQSRAAKRHRKLLLHRKQLDKLIGAVTREGRTIIPHQAWPNDKGLAKLEIALAKGKKTHDKRKRPPSATGSATRPGCCVTGADVEAIERATVAAVAPREALEIGGWLVALNGRNHSPAASAVPLSHELAADPGVIDQIEAAWRRARLGWRSGRRRSRLGRRASSWRGAAMASSSRDAGQRRRRGRRIAAARGAAGAGGAGAGRRLGPGVHQRRLRRGRRPPPGGGADALPDAVYGGISRAIRPWRSASPPSATVGQRAWHAHRRHARRGAGRAGAGGLATAAQARGVQRIFLQVEEGNTGARSLYRRAGFTQAWRYFYWSRQASAGPAGAAEDGLEHRRGQAAGVRVEP